MQFMSGGMRMSRLYRRSRRARLPRRRRFTAATMAHVGVAVDERVNRLIATCAIDNLGKGAAGAALQNLNLMAGLDETAGLRFPGVMP